MSGVRSSISAFIEDKRIIDDETILENYSKDLSYPLVSSKMPDMVVKIQSREEIIKIVHLANKEKISLIPKSSKFSLFGGAIPEKNGIILDLQEMNQIKIVDPRNMHVLIEPGVTFKQLQQELDKEKLRILPTIYNSSNSIISNYLERYPRFSMPKFEYTDLIATLEVVLPTGEVLHSGSSALPKSAPIYPYGPSVDFYRIFFGARGTYGIVSAASIRVKPKPKIQKIITFQSEKLQDFINFIYQLERKEIGAECLILNNISANLLFQEQGSEFHQRWNIFVCLEGLERHPQMKIDYEEDELLKIAKTHNIPINGEITEKSIQVVLNEFNFPNSEYRRREGLFNLPLHGPLDCIMNLNSKIEKMVSNSELNITLGVCIIPIERCRACYIEFLLDCNLNNDMNVENFRNLFRVLGDMAISSGAMIDIPFGPLRPLIYSKMKSYKDYISSIKNMLDPFNILNPGKLG